MDSLEDPTIPSCLGEVCWSNAEVAPVSWGNLTKGDGPQPRQTCSNQPCSFACQRHPNMYHLRYFCTPLTKTWIWKCKVSRTFVERNFVFKAFVLNHQAASQRFEACPSSSSTILWMHVVWLQFGLRPARKDTWIFTMWMLDSRLCSWVGSFIASGSRRGF